MNKNRYSLLFICFLLFLACTTSRQSTENQKEKGLSYLALGDSYTIGEAVEKEESFPYLLRKKVIESGKAMQEPTIIAKTGWRTDELLLYSSELREKYDLVSLLIGVNNQYQGKDMGQYMKEFPELLDRAINLSKAGAKGVFVFSIPDYSVTPFARNKKTKKIEKELIAYNKYAQSVCEKNKVAFYNITSLSRMAKKDTELLADDKLHPSAKMYRLWIKKWSGSIINDQLN